MTTPVPFSRRGACPALQSPMATGDGLLARLGPPRPPTPEGIKALCAQARKHGNGVIEVTQRGNLQARGLSEASAPMFAEEAIARGLAQGDGLPVLVDPLAGENTRALARAIRDGARGLVLAPKMSVIVDTGTILHLDGLVADVRLRAEGNRWHLGVGRTWLGLVDDPVAAVLEHLRAIAAVGPGARGRDMNYTAATPPPARPRAEPVGVHGDVVGVGLPFGAISADALEALADGCGARAMIAAAPYALLLVGAAPGVRELAAGLGFITEADDPRRFVIPCAGAPACASAFWPARQRAAEVATACAGLVGPDLIVHLSGCGKGCAYPWTAPVVVVGDAEGLGIVVNGKAGDAPTSRVADPGMLGHTLSRLAADIRTNKALP
ncbi:hypothetical protein ACM64Y_02975 [Novispirillum sp. DQ9]|uniref:hypothetical protein n=1 Tax=Novispirillum sp. DQ9 TaxID=3398612 RepID=UPI003C7D0D26